jgi:hypothetical protein
MSSDEHGTAMHGLVFTPAWKRPSTHIPTVLKSLL